MLVRFVLDLATLAMRTSTMLAFTAGARFSWSGYRAIVRREKVARIKSKVQEWNNVDL